MTIFDVVRPLLQARFAPYMAGIMLAIVVLTTAYYRGWLGLVVASSWFWPALGLFLVAALIAGWRWGIPWWRERRFVRRRGSAYVAAGQESPEEFRAKFLFALQTLKGLPQLKGTADPVYVLPWYILIGDSGAGKTATVRGADLFSPLTAPPDGDEATQNFDCWVSNSAVILDTTGRYASPADVARDRAEWYRLLRLIREHRPRQPVNGLVISIAADVLAGQAEEALRAEGSKFRERIEEAVRELGVDFPIYVLVTKCDLIDGFNEFFGQLPERMVGEVVGYVDDPTPNDGKEARGAAALGRLSAALRDIYGRLHLFRLSILEGKAPAGLRPAIFCFPEEFRALQSPLLAVMESLISEDVRYHTPLLRGIFFVSAQQKGKRVSLLRRALRLAEETSPAPGTGKRYFLQDLFNIMLPRDRGLMSMTARERRWRSATRGLGLLLSVGAVLLAVILVLRALVIDWRIAAAANAAACEASVQKVAASPRLREVESCRQIVQGLIDGNRGRSHWLTFGYSRARGLEQELRPRYVQKFRAELLAPLDAELERAFQAAAEPLPLMLLVARRIQLGRRCVTAVGCPDPLPEQVGPDSILMLDPAHRQRPAPQEATELRRAYGAYLHWQPEPKEGLQQDLAEDRKRLQRWLSAKEFNPDHLLRWVSERSPPLTYEDYWEMPAPITGRPSPRIDPACAGGVWEEDLAPFLQQIQDTVPEVAPRLREFREQYANRCLAEWRQFLSQFPQEAARWSGPERRRELAKRLLTERSPFRRVTEDAAAGVAAWVPEGAAAADAGWAVELSGYVASEQWRQHQDALREIAKQLEGPSREEASFKLAQKAFAEQAEQKTGSKSSHPVLRAWSLASPGQTQPPGQDVLVPLLQEPVRYVWRVVLEDAGRYLQASWTEKALAPLQGLPPAQQVLLLYGPGGKVGGFVEEFVRPFLSAEGGSAGTVLGEGVPFSPEFSQMLDDAKRLKPLLEGGSVPEPVRIRATRRSAIEGRLTLREEQTVLSVACAAKTYLVSSRAEFMAESAVTVPWSYQSCGDVAITVYLSAREPGVGTGPGDPGKRLQLSRRYGGQSAFLHFLQDFRDGWKRFPLDGFDGVDPELFRYGVSAIRVYFEVETPPSLKELMSALGGETVPAQITAVDGSF